MGETFLDTQGNDHVSYQYFIDIPTDSQFAIAAFHPAAIHLKPETLLAKPVRLKEKDREDCRSGDITYSRLFASTL
jgi:hypothetical protein